MSCATPAISVIIPTRDARSVLRCTLAALATQTIPAEQYEVIVVGGVADDAIRGLAPAQPPYHLRTVTRNGAGAAQRRNAGAVEARGELLVFIDDDMRAEPGFLAAHWNAHAEAGSRRVVVGYLPQQLDSSHEGKPLGWLELDVRRWWEDTFHEMMQPGHRFTYTEMFSGNFSIATALFRTLGGFDPQFLCHEDYEFGARLLQDGVEFHFCAQARTHHLDETDLGRSLQRKLAEGRADIQLARKHPDLICTLPFSSQIEDLVPLSKILRYAGHRWPRVTDWLMSLVVQLLVLSEVFNLRTAWLRVRAGLFAYYYWRGVLAEARDWNEVRRLAQYTSVPPVATLELAEGIDRAVQEVDKQRVSGAMLLWNGLHVGSIPAYPGAEPLRGRHLLAWLAGSGALRYARALALGDALGLPDANAPTPAKDGRYATTENLARDYPSMISPAEIERDRLQPSVVAELELAEGLRSFDFLLGSQDRRQVLVRWYARPIGWLHLEPHAFPRQPGDLVYALLMQASHKLLTAGNAPPPKQTDVSAADCTVSVVICTRDRAQNLEGCLLSLQRQVQPPLEIVVVDNASSDDATLRVARQFAVRYIREDRPGLNFARNRGLAEAVGEIVAYVDDDARPAADWVAALAGAFASHKTDAVTGLVAPAELSTREECLFEWGYGGMGHGFGQRLFRRDLLDPTAMLWASACGVGTNMAFRRQCLLDLGGFDPALDVGGPARGGGDVEMFHRLIASGCSLLYDPAVLVWHFHRRDFAGLRSQLYDNGRSFGVYLLTCVRNRTVAKRSILSFALIDWVYRWLLWRLWHPGWLPRSLVLAELHGALTSPVAYIQAVRRAKKMQA